MSLRLFLLVVFIAILFTSTGCTQQPVQVTELKHFPVNSIDEIIKKSGVVIDREISSDGNGSLRINATTSGIVRLFEVNDIDIESAHLIYQAKVRTENLKGHVYLEMWCGFSGMDEFFSRSLDNPLSGTTDWTTAETSFVLKEGQNPDFVKLNLIVDGKGTVWIDDIRLLKGLLQ